MASLSFYRWKTYVSLHSSFLQSSKLCELIGWSNLTVCHFCLWFGHILQCVTYRKTEIYSCQNKYHLNWSLILWHWYKFWSLNYNRQFWVLKAKLYFVGVYSYSCKTYFFFSARAIFKYKYCRLSFCQSQVII